MIASASLRVRFHNRLRENPKAQHCVANHKDQHRILASACGTAVAKHRIRRNMPDPHRDDMACYNCNNREIPDGFCIDDADVDPVEHGSNKSQP